MKKNNHQIDIMDIAIIGGGASGLMAAMTAAEQGKKVLLLEQQEKAGRKLAATGNGKCNFTNANMRKEAFFQGDFQGEKTDFLDYALHIFPPEKAINFFEESGIYTTQKNGYYYPLSCQAELVKEALLFRVNNRTKNILCKYNCRVTELKKKGTIFFVILENGYQYQAKKVILACGNMAAPQLGGSASGLSLAKQMGHTIIPVLPALCGLKTSYPDWNKMGNIRILTEISIYCEKEKKQLIGKEYGELQITSYGLSGIPVFQLSIPTVRLLEKGTTIVAVLNFSPKKSERNCSSDSFSSIFLDFLKRQALQEPCKPVLLALSGILPEKLSKLLLIKVFGKQKKNQQETIPLQFIEEKKLEELVQAIQAFEIPITGYTGFEHSQAASGGVCTKEISSETMESKLVSGLYFTGELIDIVGICGGYNLHWAWASGYLAGMAAAKERKET